MPAEEELVQEMRGNANRLSDCLDSLLRRIEQLEQQRMLNNSSRAQSPTARVGMGKGKGQGSANHSVLKENGIGSPPAGGESRREYVSVDPLTGQRKMVTVFERQLPSGPLRAQSPTMLNGGLPAAAAAAGAEQQQNGGWTLASGCRLLASAYESRIVEVQPQQLEGLELEQICGQLVAVKVTPELSKLVRPGDTLLELDGQPLTHQKQLHQPKGAVQLKLILSDLYCAPMEFCRVLDDYQANQPADDQPQQQPKALPYLSFPLQRGDILQVLSRDSQYFQARKVNDLSTAGFVPNNIRTRPVAMLCPYGRRVIAMLGANGVGRRTLKRMLIEYRPHQFQSVVPVTSRAPKPGEQQGREYRFERKETILQQIRERQMIEWGEYNGQLYGTTADSVRQVVRSGRVCVLDCTLKAMECLYNAEFMPFIVLVVPPPLDELLQLSRLHGGMARSEQELRRICEQSERLIRESDWARQADLVLVNRNRDVSLRRLLDSLEALKSEAQWIPLEWLHAGAAPPKKATAAAK